jgi:hypothetical protein
MVHAGLSIVWGSGFREGGGMVASNKTCRMAGRMTMPAT